MSAFASHRRPNAFRAFVRRGRSPSSGGTGPEVEHDELARLREENAYLRLERQRAQGIGRAAERVREAVESLASSPAEQADDAWAIYTEASVMRETLAAACNDMQVALAQLQRQLAAATPAPELDRRVDDRRFERPVAMVGTEHRADLEIGPAPSLHPDPGSVTPGVLRGGSPAPVIDLRDPLALPAPSELPTMARTPERAPSDLSRAELTAALVAASGRPAHRRAREANTRNGTGRPPMGVLRLAHPFVAELRKSSTTTNPTESHQ